MLEIEPTGQRGRALRPPEVVVLATMPLPAQLQKHLLGGCTYTLLI